MTDNIYSKLLPQSCLAASRSLRFVLPCDGCCKGFEKILEITKFGAKDLTNRNTLFAWTVKAHALVNAKTGKAPRDDPEFWMKQYLALAL
jgi:hypothetical protein